MSMPVEDRRRRWRLTARIPNRMERRNAGGAHSARRPRRQIRSTGACHPADTSPAERHIDARRAFSG